MNFDEWRDHAAELAYAAHGDSLAFPWTHLPEAEREKWRGIARAVLAEGKIEVRPSAELADWHHDCGGDWVLSGSNYFANYWPDNTVIASILDGPDGNELATSGIQPFASKAQCMAYAEWWIRAELAAMKTNEIERTDDGEE